MENTQLQECINECESALSHLQHAMSKMDHEQSRAKMEHAQKDLLDCIEECKSMLM
ncbi:hypothetical protein ERJ70_06955 [Sediminibacillus dalangtanensis]|uniref:Uncharacterized protein n=1 Tax=Sediminibacillus dalangtanensis TaxID=2729421 RepID=A0ABX7VQ49_9BACI|nr:hypothetical protein [Sediminibacillus dalangtanensis]QTM99062.1 hypothetical protein ERJ70_06955 [Sediminibacillus dalangtanensis]